MVDAFAADLASGLLRKIISIAAEELIQAWGLEENLQALRERLELVDALLSYADSKQVTVEAVHVWLKKLTDVARVADALMEELNYEVLRRRVEGRKVCDFIFRSKNSNILYRFKMSHKIKNINISLDKIYKWAQEIGLRAVEHLNATVQRSEIRHTPPSIDKTQILGRDDDISRVVKLLCENNEKDHLSVIAVVGLGGLGKTTLARLVYKSDEVMSFFQKKIWVTISDDFDVIRVLNEMVQSLTGTNPLFSNQEAAIKKLQENIKGETFLLVLDDVWNQNSEKWDCMRSCLVDVGGAKGSKIMVTTRKDEVVSTMQISPTYQVFTHMLLGLSGEDSWQLFKQITFRLNGVVENDNLERMGRRMVERCGGLPLAIKALGGLLYSKKSEQDWLSIQNSETWLIRDVLPSLKLTYNNLSSSSLKHCFAYCATFPKDFDIKKDKLIQIWMALGLLQPPRGSDLAMEDIGNEYFSTLLGNYLLQDVEEDADGNIIGCKMHDLVHDLALDASRIYCKTLEASEVNHVCEAVHVWLKVAEDIKPKISKGSFESVQTLNLTGGGILGNMIPNLTNLTVLVLDSYNITKLPSSVGQLKYLRYLDIEFTKIRELPDSITKLYNLQTLRFGDLWKLPKKFGNLINMRHIHSSPFYNNTSSMDDMFIDLERLTCLQTLTFFVVGRDKKFRIENLGGLNNLKGGLSIYGLEEVTNMGDARKANLSKKSKIQHLEFHWKPVGHDNLEYNDEDVLEGLEPPAYMKKLNVENFKGKKFASWMITESRSSVVLENLVDICLRNCNRCEGIPPLGHLPNLKSVDIYNMRNVKRIGKEFYGGHGDAKIFSSLRELTLWGMTMLEEWMEADTVLHDPKSFPFLESLLIAGCDNLMILPSHFPSLKKLRIDGMNCVALEKICTKLNSLTNLDLYRIKGGSIEFNSSIVVEFLVNNKSLRKLILADWDALPYFLSSTSLIGLEELTIGPFLADLDHFPWPFSSVSSLNYLHLIGWPKLKSLPEQLQHLSSYARLTGLRLERFDGLDALPDWLGNLSSLQRLGLSRCRNLVRMPTSEAMKRLTNLKTLVIADCKLLKERCAQESGPEWCKIAHIPRVHLYPY